MGFFDMFKKKSEPAAPAGPLVVAADARGTVVKMEDIPDEVFAQGILGDNGVEVLIHVGVDTVEMKGDGFASSVKLGDKVRKGQKLLTMDLEKIKAAGHPAVVITVITNGDDFASTELAASGTVEPGADLFRISKN